MSTQFLDQEKKGAPSTISDLTFDKIPVEGYEEVIKICSKSAKLTAIIAIHNTSLGDALGGTRIHPYASFDEALEDVLRLSKGMTYKSALASSGTGGGKSVIIADPKTEKTDELLSAFGKAVHQLKGRYICAEDMGCTPEDALKIQKETPYVVGLPHEKSSGDPSPYTAWGVYRGIQSVIQKVYGRSDLSSRTVAVQGLGSVGEKLVNILYWAGANIIVTDVDEKKVLAAVKKYGAKAVSLEEIYSVECDVFAPCARGGIINSQTIPKLKCKAIAGCANNQLLEESDAEALKEKNILYAPDFVINSGGLINVSCELTKEGYHPNLPRKKTQNIFQTLMSIYEVADKMNISTHQSALTLAEYRLQYKIGKREEKPCFHHSL